MKGSLTIILFFIIGVLMSQYGFTPNNLLEQDYSEYVLCALMFFVGVSIGCDTQIVSSVRSQGFKILLLPFGTIIGTLVGVAIASVFISKYSLRDCLAVGSGFGYYSLSSIFITQYRGAELGTVALVSNIMREIITLLFAPMLVMYFGKLSPISAGGATTADTTLPIITKVSGPQFAVLAVVHGIVVDLSVPFLVTLFVM